MVAAKNLKILFATFLVSLFLIQVTASYQQETPPAGNKKITMTLHGQRQVAWIYLTFPSKYEGKNLEVLTDSKGHKIVVQLWKGIIPEEDFNNSLSETYKGVLVASSPQKEFCSEINPVLNWEIKEGFYTLVFIHWPNESVGEKIFCGCKNYNPIEMEYTINYGATIYGLLSVKEAKLIYGVKGANKDDEAINLLDEKLPIKSIYPDNAPAIISGDNVVVVGGPIANIVSEEINYDMKVKFKKKSFGIELWIPSYKFTFYWEDFGKKDYGLITAATFKDKTYWTFQGCSRYGTLAAVIYFLQHPSRLRDKSMAVVEWIDRNHDGKVSYQYEIELRCTLTAK